MIARIMYREGSKLAAERRKLELRKAELKDNEMLRSGFARRVLN
jgi:hypothetical protein